jgi:hypothetical protein
MPMTDTTETDPVREGRAAPRAGEPRPGAWAMALPVGILAAMVGLLPWWVTGARLPLQDLWEGTVRAAAMPITLLPFSQYFVVLIFALLIVGAAAAGIGGRALRVGGWGVLLLVAGVLLVQINATVQTALVVREGVQERLESTLYVSGLTAGTGLSILIGIIVTVLIARAPRAGALIGLTVGAIGMASWTSALIDPTRLGDGPQTVLLVIVPWIAPVLTGIAIAWSGIDTAGRVLSALFALVLVWVAPAVTTAIVSALGSRALLRSGRDVVDYGIDVFQEALLTPELALRPIIATAVVAAVGLLVRLLVTRRRRHALR